MFRRPLLAAAFATVTGFVCLTSIHARCTDCPQEITSTFSDVVSTLANDSTTESAKTRKFFVKVPVGSKVTIPAGSQLWPENPVVISDERVSDIVHVQNDMTTPEPSDFQTGREHDGLENVLPSTPTPRDENQMVRSEIVVQDEEPASTVPDDKRIRTEREADSLFANSDEVDLYKDSEATNEEDTIATAATAQSEEDEILSWIEPTGTGDVDLVFTDAKAAEVAFDEATLVGRSPQTSLEWSLDEALQHLDDCGETSKVTEAGLAALLRSDAEAPQPDLERLEGNRHMAEAIVAVNEKTETSDLGWLPPFVLIPVLGLFWAERIRRERAKKRFERAIEHGKRVQRLPVSVQPLPEYVPEEELANFETAATETTTATTETTSATELVAAAPAATTEETTMEMRDMGTMSRDLERLNSEVETMQGEWKTAPATPQAAPAAMEPKAAPAMTNAATAFMPPIQPSTEPSGEMRSMESSPQSTPLKALSTETTENDPRIGTTTTDWTVVETTEESTIDGDAIETHHFAVGSTFVPPIFERDLEPKSASAETTQEDREFGEWTGVLEDATTMRAEIAGFEQRSQDFRERWDRQAAKTAVDAKKEKSGP